MAYRGDMRPYVVMEFTMKQGTEELEKEENIYLPGLNKRQDWTYACWDIKDFLSNSELLNGSVNKLYSRRAL